MIPKPRIADIQRAVSIEFMLDPNDMTSQQRARAIARPRQLAMFLSRALTPRSLPEIGRMFGGRDHSTVIFAVEAVQARLQEDEELRARADHVIGVLAKIVDERRPCVPSEF